MVPGEKVTFVNLLYLFLKDGSHIDIYMNHPVSFHAVYESSILEALKNAVKFGFNGIQVAVDSPHFDLFNLSNPEINEIIKICRKNQLYIVLHGPDEITSLFTSNHFLQNGIFNYFSNLFDFAEKIQCKMVTIHLGRMTTFPTSDKSNRKFPEEDLSIYKDTLKNNLERLTSMVNGRFFLCVENYGLEEEIFEVIHEFLKENKLWLCWDLPKTYSRIGNLNEKLFKFYSEHINSVKQLHIHDMDSKGHGHQVLGSGILDFTPLYNCLNEAELEDVCFEVRPAEKALESFEFINKNKFF